MVPLLFVSNVLKMFWLKFSALPLEIVQIKKSNCVFFSNLGKIFEYMAMNFSLLSSPLGQSFRKPSYHSCNWKMIPQCCSGWSLSSFLSMSTHMRVLGFPSTVAWNDSDVPNGQNDWPFWTTLDPFGPLWNIDKPCHVLEIWDALCYCRLHFKDKLVDDSAKLSGR